MSAVSGPYELGEPPAGPYAQAAKTYWAAGWKGCLPLPAGSKGPVPKGFTGNAGAWPSFPDLMAWMEDKGAGNVALRLPPDVLGIDVDHYDGKPGGAVLGLLEGQLGALPPTWRTTSRDDGSSGIRLFRIPVGLRWPGVLGPGIETIRYEHRYAVVWPSVHPNGGTYRWITPEGATSLGGVPTVDALPELPAAWVAHFTKGELATEQARADLGDREADEWVVARGQGVKCRHMASALEAGLLELTAGGARHDAALALTNRLAWLIGEGHTGGELALNQAGRAFLKAAAGAREGLDAEWARMLTGAVKMAAAAHPEPNIDPCSDPWHGLLLEGPSSPPHLPPAQATTPASTAGTSTALSGTVMDGPSSTAAAVEAHERQNRTDSGTVLTAAEHDDMTELDIRRRQAAAVEVERIRAQRAAIRILEHEDRDDTIADRVRRRILDDDASAEYKRQTEPPAPPFDLGLIGQILARPADPPMRCDRLVPWAGSTLLVAQRKTGKTTLLLNYARCLITGEAFLGEFPVIPLAPDERIAFLNYEVSGAQLARWAHECGIPEDRLLIVNLRGRRNPLSHPEDRAALVAALREHNVKVVMVDPFGRAYTGQSQNDNGEVQAFLVDLDMFARAEVGALDLLLATHAGWDGERTRGASALEDWPDVIITLTRDPDDEARRFIKALGRDVDVDEDELSMDPLTRVLTRTGNGGRKDQKGDREASRLAQFVIRAAAQNPGASKGAIIRAIREMSDAPDLGKYPDTKVKEAVEWAEQKGRLRRERGGNGRGDQHFEVTPEGAPAARRPIPTPTTETTEKPLNSVVPQTTETAVYEAVSVVGGAGEPAEPVAAFSGSRPTRGATFLRDIQGERYEFDREARTITNTRTGVVEPWQ
ncbi:hypothetical protein GCM10027053_51700 [Intrasporangium mesophilum]